MSHKASVAIFKKSINYPGDISRPSVPDKVFQAVKRVVKSKGHEIVDVDGGFYIVKYSKSGPFKKKLGKEWLPVYVSRVDSWSSGGIKKSEMEEFDAE